MYNKICQDCGIEFIATGPSGKYCSEHAMIRRKVVARNGSQRYRIKHGLVQKPGVGKGGNNSKKEHDSQYKSGIMWFQRNRKRIKDERRYCEDCNRDLINVSKYHWCVHHKDHDRTNNEESNLKLLCKRCHQLEHDCISNLKSVETIRKE